MINIGNNSIDNILVGDTLVDKVYLGTDVVWEHLQHELHDYVEIGGVQWATMNIGANNVTDVGLYFLWGDTQGYAASQIGSGTGLKYFSWADYKYSNNGGSSTSSMTKYNSNDGKTVLEASDDAVTAAWGDSWRTPTKDEYTALFNAVNISWADNYQGSGVAGMLFTDKTDNSKVLFFPGSGYCDNGRVYYTDTGYYWSSSRETYATRAHCLYFFDCYKSSKYYHNRYIGLPVRAVRTTNNS